VDGSDYEALFIKPWWAAQIISMYKTEGNDAIEMEVRWYNTSKDCGIEEDEEDLLKQLYETNTTNELSISLILGPVNIFTSIDEYAGRDDEDEGKLPIKNFVCNKFWNGAKIDEKIVDFTYKGSFSRCIKCSSSKEYKAWILDERKQKRKRSNCDSSTSTRQSKRIRTTRKSHDDESKKSSRAKGNLKQPSSIQEDSSTISNAIDNDTTNSTNEEGGVVSNEPYFYKNKSTNQKYFKSITLQPPSSDIYQEDCIPKYKNDTPWSIKIGDTVAIHSEASKQTTLYPFNIPWYAAEIITMFSTSNDEQFRKKDLQIEVRWLYSRHDLPRSVQNALPLDEEIIDEVYESDHVDVCDATSILSPVRLFSSIQEYESFDKKENESFQTLDFICGRRIWSVLRGTFMPCGSLQSRVERGRMHSHELKNDPSLILALKQNDAISTTTTNPNTSSKSMWIKRYLKAITKLTLSSASRDASLSLEALPCRESKIEELQSFLISHFHKESSADVAQDAFADTTQNRSCPNFFIGG